MNDNKDEELEGGATSFSREVGKQEARRIIALGKAEKSIWFGFGMSGLVGWSIALPAVLGALLGLWIDKRYPSSHSWTLALLAAGLIMGCWNAWNWVNNEDRAMARDRKESND
jgi:ATP synthase protein I